jgi:hypothetical protein
MEKRLITPRSFAIAASLALIAVVVLVVGWLALGGPQRGQRLTIMDCKSCPVGETTVEYVLSDRGIALSLWCAGRNHRVGFSSQSVYIGSTTSTADGSFSIDDRKPIKWEWQNPREKGGDFEINGTRYDLSKGTLFHLSTKDGLLQVTQLDVDLSQIQPSTEGFEGLAQKVPRLAKLIAETLPKK